MMLLVYLHKKQGIGGSSQGQGKFFCLEILVPLELACIGLDGNHHDLDLELGWVVYL